MVFEKIVVLDSITHSKFGKLNSIFFAVVLSTNITLLRGGTQNFSLVFESQIPNPTSSQRYDYNRIKYCCAKQHSL